MKSRTRKKRINIEKKEGMILFEDVKKRIPVVKTRRIGYCFGSTTKEAQRPPMA